MKNEKLFLDYIVEQGYVRDIYKKLDELNKISIVKFEYSRDKKDIAVFNCHALQKVRQKKVSESKEPQDNIKVKKIVINRSRGDRKHGQTKDEQIAEMFCIVAPKYNPQISVDDFNCQIIGLVASYLGVPEIGLVANLAKLLSYVIYEFFSKRKKKKQM